MNPVQSGTWSPCVDDVQQVRDVDRSVTVDVAGTTRTVDLAAGRQAVPDAVGIRAGCLDGPEAGVPDATGARWLTAVDIGIVATGSNALPIRVDEAA